MASSSINTGLFIVAAAIIITANGVKVGDRGKVARTPTEANAILQKLTNGERRNLRKQLHANGFGNLAKAGTPAHLNRKDVVVAVETIREAA